MKITYEFVTGEVSEVEVDERLGGMLLDLDRQQENNDQKETRRHFSLDGMGYEGELFASAEDTERAVEHREDMEVQIACDGKEGLNMFHRESYDLILLDLEMPRMSGEELLREVRRENPYIDIIVYTNYERFGDIKKLVNMGINGYVNKGPSADLQELIDMIKSKLEPMDEEEISCLIQNTEELHL